MTYNVHEAKTNLSRLLEQAQAGEDVVIARDGKPVAKLVAIGTAKKQRKPGRYKGKIIIKPGFYAPMSKKELKLWGIE